MKPGESLKGWREERHLSQTAAARLLDPPATQSAWAAWESGAKPPSLGNALGIERLTEGLVAAGAWVVPRKASSRPAKKKRKAATHRRAA